MSRHIERQSGYTSSGWSGDRRWLDCLAAERAAESRWGSRYGGRAPLGWLVAEVAALLALGVA